MHRPSGAQRVKWTDGREHAGRVYLVSLHTAPPDTSWLLRPRFPRGPVHAHMTAGEAGSCRSAALKVVRMLRVCVRV